MRVETGADALGDGDEGVGRSALRAAPLGVSGAGLDRRGTVGDEASGSEGRGNSAACGRRGRPMAGRHDGHSEQPVTAAVQRGLLWQPSRLSRSLARCPACGPGEAAGHLPVLFLGWRYAATVGSGLMRRKSMHDRLGRCLRVSAAVGTTSDRARWCGHEAGPRRPDDVEGSPMVSSVICEGSRSRGFRWQTAIKKFSVAASSVGRPHPNQPGAEGYTRAPHTRPGIRV